MILLARCVHGVMLTDQPSYRQHSFDRGTILTRTKHLESASAPDTVSIQAAWRSARGQIRGGHASTASSPSPASPWPGTRRRAPCARGVSEPRPARVQKAVACRDASMLWRPPPPRGRQRAPQAAEAWPRSSRGLGERGVATGPWPHPRRSRPWPGRSHQRAAPALGSLQSCERAGHGRSFSGRDRRTMPRPRRVRVQRCSDGLQRTPRMIPRVSRIPRGASRREVATLDSVPGCPEERGVVPIASSYAVNPKDRLGALVSEDAQLVRDARPSRRGK
jgi:hypothetical protein